MTIDQKLTPNQILWILDDLATHKFGQNGDIGGTINRFKHKFPSLSEEKILKNYGRESKLRGDVLKSILSENTFNYFKNITKANPNLANTQIDPIIELFNKDFDLDLSSEMLEDGVPTAARISVNELKSEYEEKNIYYYDEIKFQHGNHVVTLSITHKTDYSSVLSPLVVSNLYTQSFNYHPHGAITQTYFNLYLERLNCYLQAENRHVLLCIPEKLSLSCQDLEHIRICFTDDQALANFIQTRTFIKKKILKVFKEYVVSFDTLQDIVIQMMLRELETCSKFTSLNDIKLELPEPVDIPPKKTELIQDVYNTNVMIQQYSKRKNTTKVSEIKDLFFNKFYPFILIHNRALELPASTIIKELMKYDLKVDTKKSQKPTKKVDKSTLSKLNSFEQLLSKGKKRSSDSVVYSKLKKLKTNVDLDSRNDDLFMEKVTKKANTETPSRNDKISDNVLPKPAYTYTELVGIALVILEKPSSKQEIMDLIKDTYQFYNNDEKWQKHIRKCLNKSFFRAQNDTVVVWSIKEEDKNKYSELLNKSHHPIQNESIKERIRNIKENLEVLQQEDDASSSNSIRTEDLTQVTDIDINSSRLALGMTPVATESNDSSELSRAIQKDNDIIATVIPIEQKAEEVELSEPTSKEILLKPDETKTHIRLLGEDEGDATPVSLNLSETHEQIQIKRVAQDATDAMNESYDASVLDVVTDEINNNDLNEDTNETKNLVSVNIGDEVKTEEPIANVELEPIIQNGNATKSKKDTLFTKITNKIFKSRPPKDTTKPLDKFPKLNSLKLPITTIETKTILTSPLKTSRLFEVDSDHFVSDDDSD